MKEIIKGLRIILVGVTYGYGGMLLGKGCNIKGFITYVVATTLIYLFTRTCEKPTSFNVETKCRKN